MTDEDRNRSNTQRLVFNVPKVRKPYPPSQMPQLTLLYGLLPQLRRKAAAARFIFDQTVTVITITKYRN
jgi:hypothetical protein